ncbi:MAG: small multi-drug export protein, partial [Clostridia bacterium]|nr:small multi-drug export protein [Clostridia bacterium]
LTTVLISMIPIVELRGAIPAAITMGLKPLVAFALAWAGSAIVSPILLLILRPVLNWMKKYKIFASLAQAVEDGFKGKAMKVVGKQAGEKLTGEELKRLERKKMFGVYLFVAFPIPLTGVWTGSAIATFIDIPFWKAMAMVWLGNLTAGAIVTLLAFFLSAYMNIILDIFFIIVILVLLLFIARTVIKMVKNKKAKATTEQSQDGGEVLQDIAEENQDQANANDSLVQEKTETEEDAADSARITHTSTNAKSLDDKEEK